MSPENFCYWLKGYFEIREALGHDKESLTINQVNVIQDHLDLVHRKVTPNINGPAIRPTPEEIHGSLSKNSNKITPNLDEMIQQKLQKLNEGLGPNEINFAETYPVNPLYKISPNVSPNFIC